ncbi:MAG: FIST signal transduction protein, partial [Prochlorotrichaceae cyanobacterium]
QEALGASADLGIVFISSTFASEYPRLLPLLREHLAVKQLIGCGGGSIVGVPLGESAREIEQEPALSLTLAHLPGVTVQSFHLEPDDLPDLDSPPQAWVDCVGVAPQDRPSFVVLADPFSSRINDLLQGLDFAYAGCPKVGGLASGRSLRGGSGLFCNDRYYESGSVGIALSGAIEMKTIVAQGCRPIGPVFQVVEGEQNVLLQLMATDSNREESALEALQGVVQSLEESDRQLAQHSLFVGLAHSEFQLELQAGDFLIRNLIGVDPRIGALAIGDRIRPGQRLQFHLRDGQTSEEDLRILLRRFCAQSPDASALGGLMFSCLGRGQGLYQKPDFDATLFQQYLGQIPLGGFFCNGEIGPIGGSTYLHGYTSAFGVFCPSTPEA